jgi:hypothetical protein
MNYLRLPTPHPSPSCSRGIRGQSEHIVILFFKAILALSVGGRYAGGIRGQSEHIVILFFKAILALSVGGRYAGTAQTPDSFSMGAFPTRE